MHRPPPHPLRQVWASLSTFEMYRDISAFVRTILTYGDDPAVHMTDFDEFLPPGSDAPDFELPTLDGETVSLADHRGTWVVLEFGSFTCPQYRSVAAALAAVARRWTGDDVQFYLVYQFDAHPNQGVFRDVDQPTTDDERRALATRLAAAESVDMPILVDEVPRHVSALYGGAPNMVYVVAPDGTVAYRSLWTDPDAVEAFLAANVPSASRP